MEEKKQPELRPGYWAVIPAEIRYDDRIPPNAKILYAEISSLTGATGYCWADDAYFAKLYRMSERTIRSLIKALADQGYIRIEREAGQHNTTAARRIYAGLNPLAPGSSLEKICQTESAVRKKLSGSLEETFQTEPGHIIKEQEILTRVREQSEKSLQAPVWKPERFDAFWSYYRKIPGEGGRNRNENRQAAMRAWDRLQPDDALIDTIAAALLRQRKTPEWTRGVGIPMAATYLNQRRWEDAPEETEAETPGAPYEGRRDIEWI